MIYADTSFLASVYGDDGNTRIAREFITKHRPRLPFVFLHWPEMAKAFWIAQPEMAESLWALMLEDLAQGQKLFSPDLDVEKVARRAAGLIKNYCPRWKKLRSLDVLHVSAAANGHFKTFLSFDTGSFQRVLAHSQKLSVWPPLTADEQKHLA